jgi:lysophospholipase L1-like esterase
MNGRQARGWGISAHERMNTTTKKAANSIVGKLTAGILATAAVAAPALAVAAAALALAAAVALAVAVALAAAVAAVLAAPAAALQGGGQSVLVIGDSLEQGSGPYLRESLPGAAFEIDAEPGRTSGHGAIALGERLRPEHDAVVFPLGTNDSAANPGGLAASLATAARLAGGRCLVVATLARPPQRGVSVAGLNRVVEEFAAESGAQVMDWAAVVAALPGLLTPDRVHATGEGYQLRAGLLAEAVQACGRPAAGGDLTGLPAPRNPKAKPPPRLPAGSQSAALAAPAALTSLVDGAVSVVAAATRAAVTATRKPTAEPVLGAP